MKPSKMAPSGCIVCGKPHPRIENAPGWIYLAGAKPLGALACSAECGSVAGERFARTGRVDAPECACCLRPKPDPGESDGEMGFMAGLASCIMFARTGVLNLCPRHTEMVQPVLCAVEGFRRKP